MYVSVYEAIGTSERAWRIVRTVGTLVNSLGKPLDTAVYGSGIEDVFEHLWMLMKVSQKGSSDRRVPLKTMKRQITI